MYKELMKKSKIGNINIDATGQVVRRLSPIDGSNNILFLYQVVGEINGETAPSFQMISTKHDTNMIQYFLRETTRSGAPKPRQVTSDYAVALLNAASLAYNEMSLNRYLSSCFKQATSASQSSEKMCLIRLDIAHLIHAVSKWPSLKKCAASIKNFYIRCIGLLSKSVTVKRFAQVLRDILTVCNSETENVNDATNPCYVAQQRLFDLIKTQTEFSYEETNDDNRFIVQPDGDEDDTYSISEVSILLNKILAESLNQEVGDRPNPYHRPLFSVRILKLCQHFLLWTAIMPNIYKDPGSDLSPEGIVATSCRIEQYFKDLKHLVLEGETCLRVHKFLIKHLRSLSGSMKLLRAALGSTTSKKPQNNQQGLKSEKKITDVESASDTTEWEEMSTTDNREPTDHHSISETLINQCDENHNFSVSEKKDHVRYIDLTNNSCNSENISPVGHSTTLHSDMSHVEGQENKAVKRKKPILEDSCLQCEENWRNLIAPKRTRGIYLRPSADIENIYKRPQNIKAMPLVINGNSCSPIKIDKEFIQVTNTCAFDSFIQCLLGGFYDWHLYNAWVNDIQHEIFNFVKDLVAHGATKKIYQTRAQILMKEKALVKYEDGRLDCTCNVSALIEQLLEGLPSITKSKNCSSCGRTGAPVEHPIAYLTPADLKLMYKNGLSNLNVTFNNFTKDKIVKCRTCKNKTCQVTYSTFQQHLWIDLEQYYWPSSAQRQGCEEEYQLKFALNEVPDHLERGGAKYRLVGIITHVAMTPINHYRCFLKRIHGKWEQHDGLNPNAKPFTVRSVKKEHKIVLLFYVYEEHNT